MNADTWESRIDGVSKVLNLTHQEVTSRLKDWGIEKEPMGLEMLDDDDVVKFGDFQNIFKSVVRSNEEQTVGNLEEFPLAKLRLAFKFLKGSKKTEDRGSVDQRTLELKALGFKMRIEDASPEALLKLYIPEKPSDPITQALRKKFGDKKVIVFSDDGKVDVERTVSYISDLEQGFEEQETVELNGKLVRLWPVGVKPNVLLDEDPLFPGKPLRNDRSTVNHRNWSKVSVECRQLCAIIVERSDIDTGDREAVLKLMERAEKGIEAVREAYPEAELDYRERKDRDQLPKLKVPMGGVVQANNPFSIGKNRRY